MEIKNSTATIEKITIHVNQDPDSHHACKVYLAEFTQQAADYHLNRRTGEFRSPYGLLAKKCSANWEGINHCCYSKPAQHLPHNPDNWNHVQKEVINKHFKANAAKFAKYDIIPVLKSTPKNAGHTTERANLPPELRTKQFWLDVLQAVEGCELLETHNLGTWSHKLVHCAAELKITLMNGKTFQLEVRGQPIYDVAPDPTTDQIDTETKLDRLNELKTELEEFGFSQQEINHAIVEHLGPEYVSTSASA
jgi:hypothetical protein